MGACCSSESGKQDVQSPSAAQQAQRNSSTNARSGSIEVLLQPVSFEMDNVTTHVGGVFVKTNRDNDIVGYNHGF